MSLFSLKLFQLLRRDIDSYIKGATIPTFQLEYDWIRDSVPERLKHSVEFKPTGWGMNVSINPGSSTLLQHQGKKFIYNHRGNVNCSIEIYRICAGIHCPA